MAGDWASVPSMPGAFSNPPLVRVVGVAANSLGDSNLRQVLLIVYGCHPVLGRFSNGRWQLVRESSAADRWGRRVGLLGTALVTNRLVCPVDSKIDS